MPVRVEPRGAVLLVTIDRPEARNAIDLATQGDLVRAWERLRDDDAFRAAVLTGSGEQAFCAGIDLKQIDQWYAQAPPGKRREVWDRIPGLGGLTRNLDPGKPVVAAINGHCLGGGLELALACDIRVASERATFGLPEVKWGILPGQGGTQRLPRVVAPNLALELLLTADPIDAQRALAIGLVNRLVPQERVLPEALALAERIASRSPQAVRRAREAVLRGLDLPLPEALKLEQLLADPLRDSEDSKEARRAFAEKREPAWTGR